MLAFLILSVPAVAYCSITLALEQTLSDYVFLFGVLMGFLFALLHAGQRLGWKQAVGLCGLTFIVSLTFESVGVATGLIYAPYHYSQNLGPMFLNLVPLIIPVAWFMMIYPSFVIADWLIPAGWEQWRRLLSVAAIGGLVMTAWDVVGDPVAVAHGSWAWEVNGPYFGIPLQNFWGWWLTTFVVFALYLLWTRRHERTGSDAGFDRLAVVFYAVKVLGDLLYAVLRDMGGPALVGFFAVTPWVTMGWIAMNDRSR
jgi:putative membrane protein